MKAVLTLLTDTGRHRPAGINKGYELRVGLPSRRLSEEDDADISVSWTVTLTARDRAHALAQCDEWLLRAYYHRISGWHPGEEPNTEECDVDLEGTDAVS